MTKNFRTREIKERQSYTYEEASRVIGSNKNSVRRWAAEEDLPLITKIPQHLVLGADLKSFLIARRTKKRVFVPIGQVYCFKCKCATKPIEGSLTLTDVPSGAKFLHAKCANCEGQLRKTVNLEQLKDYGF